jgi:hypothetical protein
MTDFNALLVGGIPLIIVIFGLVEFIKSLGLKGHALTVTSLILGVLFGLAYHIAQTTIPATFGEWFTAVIFGLAMGLVASGFYKFADDRWPRVDSQ